MELLGLVETVTAAGNLVVRACTAPDVNSAVYDGGNARVGTVKRIFGPVDGPYVTVVPADRGRADKTGTNAGSFSILRFFNTHIGTPCNPGGIHLFQQQINQIKRRDFLQTRLIIEDQPVVENGWRNALHILEPDGGAPGEQRRGPGGFRKRNRRASPRAEKRRTP